MRSSLRGRFCSAFPGSAGAVDDKDFVEFSERALDPRLRYGEGRIAGEDMTSPVAACARRDSRGEAILLDHTVALDRGRRPVFLVIQDPVCPWRASAQNLENDDRVLDNRRGAGARGTGYKAAGIANASGGLDPSDRCRRTDWACRASVAWAESARLRWIRACARVAAAIASGSAPSRSCLSAGRSFQARNSFNVMGLRNARHIA